MTQKAISRMSEERKKNKRPAMVCESKSPPSTIEDYSLQEGTSPMKSINKSINSSQSGDHIIDLCMPKYSKPEIVYQTKSKKGKNHYDILLNTLD